MLIEGPESRNDSNLLDQSKLFQSFLSFVREHKLFARGDRVLLAVSGGLDSSVLTRLMAKAERLEGIVLEVAHVDHGLRGEVSKKEATWVRVLCSQLNLNFHSLSLQAEKGASQDHLRQARRQALLRLAEQMNCQHIATAHHADDNAETFLMRAMSGTGIHGLRGIRPREGVWIKPLLCAFRSELLDYARNSQLAWIEDPSNQRGAYLRNRIRQEVFPLLDDLRKSSLKNMSRLAIRLDEEENEIESWLASFLNEQSPYLLPLSLVARFPKSLERRLFRVWLKRLDVNPQPALIEALLQGRELIHPDGSFLKRSDHLVFTPEREFGSLWETPLKVDVGQRLFFGSSMAWSFVPTSPQRMVPLRLSLVMRFKSQPPPKNHISSRLMMDWDRLPRELEIRRIERQDSEEISKALSKAGIPRPYQKSWPVLIDRRKPHEVICAAGVWVHPSYRYRDVGRCVALDCLFEEGLRRKKRS